MSSPGGSNRYGKKILWNKSLIFLAEVKGGQQFVGGQVCGCCRCSVSTAMSKLNLFLVQKKMFSQHILPLCSGLEELHFTFQSVCCYAIVQGRALPLLASLASDNIMRESP